MKWIQFLLLWALGAMAGEAWLGISFSVQGVSPCTLMVAGVHPQSGALSAGVQSGDRIVGVQGQPIMGTHQLKKRLAPLGVGDQVELTLVRGQKEISLKVKMVRRPDNIRAFMESPVGSKTAQLSQSFYANAQNYQTKPKAILLDFWATWCGPCRMVLPILKNLWAKYQNQGLQIVGLSSEQLSVLEDFQEKEHLPWPLQQDLNGRQADLYGVRAIPTLVLADEKGYVQQVWRGVPSQQELEAALQRVLQ